MSESETNYLELAAELEARGWSPADMVEWLALNDHAVELGQMQYWASGQAAADGARVPRWPVLMLQGCLGGNMFPKLRYFKQSEFGKWSHWMHPALLYALDACRHALDAPLPVSVAAGALGRHLGTGSSMHNVDRLGFVFAADVILPKGYGLFNAVSAIADARVVSGIGIYPEWKQGPGLHLDMRHLTMNNQTPSATVKAPATWSAIYGSGGKQIYHSAEFVLGRS